MKKLEQAIAYFEDAIRESDEIIAPEVPDGYKEVTEIVTGVFVNEKTGEIVITGIPETVLHNCDQMGCSSIDHVIYRCRLEQ